MTEALNVLEECMKGCIDGPPFAQDFCMDFCVGQVAETDCGSCANIGIGHEIFSNCSQVCTSDLDGDGASITEPSCQSCLCEVGVLNEVAACTGTESPCDAPVNDVCDLIECANDQVCIDGECVSTNGQPALCETDAECAPGEVCAESGACESHEGDDDDPTNPSEPDASVAHEVDHDRELMITDLSVVEDPTRTASGCFPNFSDENPDGVWTFKHIIEGMAGDQDPADFVESWLNDWATRETINGFNVIPAGALEALVLAPWRDRGEGVLDLHFAPFRLLSIVNRFDLRDESPEGTAGEGRFVFGLLDADCNPTAAVIIFEYLLPADSEEEIAKWASDWHQLGALEGPAYNDALEALTREFTDAGAMPGRPNGSAINQVRSNDLIFTGRWTLREFRLDDQGTLVSAPTQKTPDASFNNSPDLLSQIVDNDPIPESTFAGEAPIEGLWNFGPEASPEDRHTFAVNTCNGCHSSETGTPFLHVSNRTMGQPTQLSGFLTGTEVPDPLTGELRSFDELGRRGEDLSNFLAANSLSLP